MPPASTVLDPLRDGPTSSTALLKTLQLPHSAVSRELQAAQREGLVVKMGATRGTRYALPRTIAGAGTTWPVFRVDPTGKVHDFGRLDALVNNASAFYATPIGSVTPAQWEELFASNARAPFFLAQAAAPHLKHARGGIVNIVDIYAERPLPGHPVYCMAKAALAMMTQALARELGPEIRVNGVAPGAVLWPESGKAYADQVELVARTPLQRAGAPDDVATAVLFLLRDAKFTTGQILRIDGGRSLAV